MQGSKEEGTIYRVKAKEQGRGKDNHDHKQQFLA